MPAATPPKPRRKPATPEAKATAKPAAKAAQGTQPQAATGTDAAQHAPNGHAPAGDTTQPAPLPDAEAVSLYLDELETHGQYMRAAATTRRNYSFFQRRRKSDPVFAAAEAEALSLAPDMIRSEIARRAMEGSVRFTRYGPYREYDNALLLRYAEYMETGQWRQRQQVETGSPGAFKTLAEAEAAVANRAAELAKARAEIAEEDAREAGEVSPNGRHAAAPKSDM